MLLAFDLSTTVCGYCIINLENKQIEKLSYFKFKTTTMLERSFELKEYIHQLHFEYKITKFIIEERLKSFRAGGTNAEAMLKTSCLNFCCQHLIKSILNVHPEELNVRTARKLAYPLFHKVAKLDKSKKEKEIAFKFVIQELGEEHFPKKILQSGPRKGQEIFIDEATDISDAYILAKAYLNRN